MVTIYLAYVGADHERVAALTAAPLPAAHPYSLVQTPRKRGGISWEHETVAKMRRCHGMLAFFSGSPHNRVDYFEIHYGRDSLMPMLGILLDEDREARITALFLCRAVSPWDPARVAAFIDRLAARPGATP